jgi:hypothetical protein
MVPGNALPKQIELQNGQRLYTVPIASMPPS